MTTKTIDTEAIKKSVDLLILSGQRTTLNGRGKEQYGPCPKCGGKDRFHVTAEKFFCRHCHPEWDDCIEFFRWLDGLDFVEACNRLAGNNPPTLTAAPATRPTPRPSPPTVPPGPTWQGRAWQFIKYAQTQLWQPTGKAGLDYLTARGFTEATIQTAGLGYNPRDITDRPESWGVTDKDKIWLPGPGVVIPWADSFEVWRINIRLLEKRGDRRYIGPAGWANGLYNADNLTATRPAILTEGELDALTIQQAAGDIITPVATGTTGGSRRDKWIARLATVPLVLIAFDADEPGDQAAKFWLDVLPNARRWRPLWGDANDMALAGTDIRAWILAGLPDFNPPAAAPAPET